MGRKVKVEARATIRVHVWIDAPDDEDIDSTLDRVKGNTKEYDWQLEDKSLMIEKSTLDIREEINTKE